MLREGLEGCWVVDGLGWREGAGGARVERGGGFGWRGRLAGGGAWRGWGVG